MGWKIRLLDKILRSKTIPEQSKRGAKTAVQTKLHWNKSSTRNENDTRKKNSSARSKSSTGNKNARHLAEQKREAAGIQPPPH